jgi:hypothetical protein
MGGNKDAQVSSLRSAVIAGAGSAFADEAAAQKWIDQEFQPSVLTKDEQLAEMQWFIDAAEPFAGMEINVLSEGIPTHSYESNSDQSVRGNHRHQGQPPDPRRRRSGAGGADPDADRPEPL